MRISHCAAISCAAISCLAGECRAQAAPPEAAAPPKAVAASSPRAAVAKLLDIGRKNTPAEVSAAQAQFKSLASTSPADVRIQYAYGLVLANQHRYKDALPLVTAYLDANPTDRPALRAKIWAKLSERRYATALDDAVTLVADAARTPAAERADSARFLGTVFAYLELTRPAAIDAKRLAARRQQVIAALDESSREAFDEGRAVVIDKLAALQDDKQTRQDRAAAEADQRKQQTGEALANTKQQAALSKEQAATSAEQVRDAQRGLTVVQHQARSLMQDRSAVGAQIFVAQSQLTGLYQQIAADNAKNNNNNGNNNNNQNNRNLGQVILPNGQLVKPTMFAQVTVLNNTLAFLNTQALDLDRRLLALDAEATQLQQKGHDEAQAVADSQAIARQSEKKATVLEKQSRRLDTTQTAKAAALTAQMKRLATYLPFPYEVETKRVLRWFQE